MPSFTDDDLEFVDEVATRLGAALNTAVLFERQSRGRSALETLQQVSGRIASVATVDQVVHAALTHGARGIGADAGAVLLIDKEHGLIIKRRSTRT